MLKISGRRINFFIHFFILAGLLIFLCMPFFWRVPLPNSYWLRVFAFYLIYVAIYFFNIHLLVPDLLFKKRTGWFVFAIFLLLMIITLLNHTADALFGDLGHLGFKSLSDKDIYYGKSLADMGSLVIISFVIGLGTIITVAQKIDRDLSEKQVLEKEKISSELSFLKAQINPHFYFNVQHSIYALTATDIEAAREALYTLSHMMRYVLYETKNNKTTLFQEIEFVESYIKLMKLRLTENVQIIVDKSRHLKNVEVAPMLFLPFIENAFKHGISSIHPSYIYIGISEFNEMLIIDIRNSLFNNAAEIKEESNGIGLVNTQRRLDLLYPNKHVINVKKDEANAEFSVYLKLVVK